MGCVWVCLRVGVCVGVCVCVHILGLSNRDRVQNSLRNVC